MKGQKVFTALYDWMLQEYQRQGVTSGKDLVMPVRTVWGWYMKGQGLQNGQRVDESETGHGLMCIVSNAACIRREVPKVDRLVVMADDEVHPTFRVRAEQWIGEEVVYICDVANHPTDRERVAICAVPQSFFEKVCGSDKGEGKSEKSEDAHSVDETSSAMPSEKNEGFEPETEPEPEVEFISQSEASVIADEIAPEVLSHGVNEDIEALEIKCSITLPSTPRENKPEPEPERDNGSQSKQSGNKKPRKNTPNSLLHTPNSSLEKGLFDDLLFEFAKSCHDSEFRCERSAWTGRYVQYYTTSDIKTLWCVGLMVITLVYYFWADWMLDNTDPLELNVVTVFAPFGVALLAWSLFVLWLNNRVDEIKKGKGRR